MKWNLEPSFLPVEEVIPRVPEPLPDYVVNLFEVKENIVKIEEMQEIHVSDAL